MDLPYKKRMDKHKLLQDMREDCECERCNYCPLEAIISVNPRMFEQHKLVEKFKFERSKILDREIDWNEAYIFWKDEKYAEKYATGYREGMTHRELEKMMEVVR